MTNNKVKTLSYVVTILFLLFVVAPTTTTHVDATTTPPEYLTFGIVSPFDRLSPACYAMGFDMAFKQMNDEIDREVKLTNRTRPGGAAIKLRTLVNMTGWDPRGQLGRVAAKYHMLDAATNNTQLIHSHKMLGLAVPTLLMGVYILYDLAQKFQVPLIGPTDYDGRMHYHPSARSVLNWNPGSKPELYTQLGFAIHGRPKCTRFLAFYLNVGPIPVRVQEYAAAIRSFGLPIRLVNVSYTADPRPAKDLGDVYDEFFADGYTPNCIVFFQDPRVVPVYPQYIQAHPRFDPQTSFFASSYSSPMEPHTWNASGPSVPPNFHKQLYHMEWTPDPHLRNTTSKLAQKYQEALADYDDVGTEVNAFNFTEHCPKELLSWQRFHTYITARLVGEVVASMDGRDNYSRTEFTETVYRRKMFTVDELVIGPYHDTCIGGESTDADCFCNIGHKTSYTAGYDDSGKMVGLQDDHLQGEFGVATLTTSMEQCKTSDPRQIVGNAHRIGLFSSTQPESNNNNNVSQAKVNVTLQSVAIGANRKRFMNKQLDRTYLMPFPIDQSVSAAATAAATRYALHGMLFTDPSHLPPEDSMSIYAKTLKTVLLSVAKTMPSTPQLLDALVPPRPDVITFIPNLADLIHGLAAYVADETAGGEAAVNNVDGATVFSLVESEENEDLVRRSFISFALEVPVALGSIAQFLPYIPPVSPPGQRVIVVVASTSLRFVEDAISAAQKHADRPITWLIAADDSHLETIVSKSGHEINATFAQQPQDFSNTTSSTVVVRSTIHFASTLPAMWSAQEPLVKWFREMTTLSEEYTARPAPSVPSSASLRAVLAFAAMDAAANSVADSYTATSLMTWFNQSRPQGVHNVQLGPFLHLCEDESDSVRSSYRQCSCSNALQQVYVHNLLSWTAHSDIAATTSSLAEQSSPIFSLESCHAIYRTPTTKDKTLLTSVLVGSIVGGIVVGTLGIVAIVAVLCKPQRGRDNKHAPIDPSKPVAVVFTDIESSTNLWAEYPHLMAKAVDEHHRILRKLITTHHGYEVKTIGDAFMIAFVDPVDAVLFSTAAQDALLDYDWGHIAFDEFYTRIVSNGGGGGGVTSLPPLSDRTATVAASQINVRAGTATTATSTTMSMDGGASESASTANNGLGDSEAEVVPPQLSPSAFDAIPLPPSSSSTGGIGGGGNGSFASLGDHYTPIWNGLRMRIGVGYGEAEIKFDAVSTGYDFYGTTVNAAARVGAAGHGGQVVVTKDVHNAVVDATATAENTSTKRQHNAFAAANALAWKELGAHVLRGIPEDVELFQCSSKDLSRREFPPLRATRAAVSAAAGRERRDDDAGSSLSDGAQSHKNHDARAIGDSGNLLENDDEDAEVDWGGWETPDSAFEVAEKHKKRLLLQNWPDPAERERAAECLKHHAALFHGLFAAVEVASRPASASSGSSHSSSDSTSALAAQTDLLYRLASMWKIDVMAHGRRGKYDKGNNPTRKFALLSSDLHAVTDDLTEFALMVRVQKALEAKEHRDGHDGSRKNQLHIVNRVIGGVGGSNPMKR